jgi:RluA family pseudouridine synthase
MKEVPFYGNNSANNHCALAIYRSLFEYFLGQKLSWKDIETFVDYKDGRAPWTLYPLTKMASLGLDIRMIEPFDYREYAKRGRAYLNEVFPKSKAEWMLANSDVLDIAPHIPEFLKTVYWENRRASLQDIDNMLTDGRLVFVTLNSRALNDQEGYVDHAILVIGREHGDYIVHDPGLPPQPNRHLSRHKLWGAMGGETHTAEVTGFKLKTQAGERLDQHVVAQMPRLSRAFAAKLINQGRVLVNDIPGNKAGYRLKANDDVTIDYDDATLDALPDIDLPILYEDDDCVIINKPAGVLTHAQGTFSPEATVATFLRSRVGDSIYGNRAGVVHRLDRATSGVIIGAKNQAALSWLQKQFASREVKKSYIAVVRGHLANKEAIIDMPIGRNPKAPATFRVDVNGKSAATHYKVLEETEEYSLVELQPETGRTHQLRVHLAKIGHPIVGDPLYGDAKFGDRLYLHALSLEIILPNRERKTFTAPLPKEFKELLHA